MRLAGIPATDTCGLGLDSETGPAHSAVVIAA